MAEGRAWAAFKAELASEMDAELGEDMRVLPMAQGRTDLLRSPCVITARLSLGPRDEVAPGRARGPTNRGPGVQASGASLRIDRGRWPELDLRPGDRLVAQSRPGAPVFEVHSIERRQMLRWVCQLGEL